MDILKNVIRKIFDSVFAPIFKTFLKDIFWDIIDLIKDVFAWVFYEVMSVHLRVVDFLGSLFEFFAGTTKGYVTYSDGVTTKQATVLEVFLGMGEVQKIFLIITLVSVLLAIVFTIIAVLRSMSDMTLENKNPVSKVLKSALKCAVTFMMVPLLCVFMLQMTSVIMQGIDTALSNEENGDITISDTIWLSASMNAAKESAYNADTHSPNIQVGANDEKRSKYVGKGEKAQDKYNYNSSSIKEDFDLSKFDYGLGITSAAVTALILAMSLLMFIRRIFEILVLYLVSPFFVATMPIDEGEMFKKWKDMFIAKFFSGFGSVIAMRLYLMVAPIIATGSVSLYPGNQRIDSIIRLILIIGGAFAVYGAQPMLLKMISYEAGAAEQQSMGVVGGLVSQSVGLVKGAGGAFANSIKGNNKGSGGGGGGGASGGGASGPRSAGGDNRNSGLDSASRLRANGQI